MNNAFIDDTFDNTEEEIVLDPPTELFEEANTIAQNNENDEKFEFILKYDVNQKDFLLSLLEALGINPSEIHENEDMTISINLNMSQLAFIKKMDFIEEVHSTIISNPYIFLEAEAASASDSTTVEIDHINEETLIPPPISTENPNIGTELLLTPITDTTLTENEAANTDVATMSVNNSRCSSCISNSTMETAKQINTESFIRGCICCPETEEWFKFTAPETTTYTIYTIGTLDTIGAIYDASGTKITCNDDYVYGNLNFRIICDLTAGETYYVKVRLYKMATGKYTIRVTKKILAKAVNINQPAISLVKGVTYELPTRPDYIYKRYNSVECIPDFYISIIPSDTTEQLIHWYEEHFNNTVTCTTGSDDDGERYCHLKVLETGTTKLYARDWNENGKKDDCIINVDSVLIYRTRNRERLGFYDQGDNNDITPITAEDLTYGKKSKDEILNISSNFKNDDFDNYNSILQRAAKVKETFNTILIANEPFEEILSEMIDHFIDGTGTDYSNETLTSAVQTHEKTINYVNSVITLVKNFISKNKQSIANLAYDDELWDQPIKRASHPLVSAMITAIENGAKELNMPCYTYKDGNWGLTLAIDSLYGNKIELENFQSTDTTYSGALKFTFYDHFGLDTSDLTNSKYGLYAPELIRGFRQWFILQHWNNLEGEIQPKPFVTKVSFSVPFSGTYE